MDFDSVNEADLEGIAIDGVAFSSPTLNPLRLVRASLTTSVPGFTPQTDSDHRLNATTHAHVLSPGGAELFPGPDPTQNDSLRLVFTPPVRNAGIDVIFQSLDGVSLTDFVVRNSTGQVIASGTLNIPALNGGTDPASAYPRGGTFFIGFHSELANIARIDFIENDNDDENSDSNIGYDSLRYGDRCPQTGAYTFTPIVTTLIGGGIGHYPAIDEAGTVVFFRDAENAGGLLTRSSHGGRETFLTDASRGLYDFQGYPAVNRAGQVAYTAQFFSAPVTLGKGIFSIPILGGLAASVADDSGSFFVFGFPAVNSAGTVVFRADSDSQQFPLPRGIYLRQHRRRKHDPACCG